LRKLSDALALGQQLGRLQRILCGEMRLKHLVRVLPLLLLLPPVLLRKVADRLVGQEVLGDLIAAEDGDLASEAATINAREREAEACMEAS
jgi:hypothetical protein